MVSGESNIPLNDFGVHGSVALSMHSSNSDIDVVVYGASNFRQLETTIDRLVREERLNYKFSNRLDAARRFKGHYRGKIFMYNAIRKPNEATWKYGEYKYNPLAPIQIRCTVKDDSQAMFRPAIYAIENCESAGSSQPIPSEMTPEFVVSMIGCYRNVARNGDILRVSGMLESVENLKTKEIFHQVVVGTGSNEAEHIWPV